MSRLLARIQNKFPTLDGAATQALQTIFRDFEAALDAAKPKETDGYAIKVDRALDCALHNLVIVPGESGPKLFSRIEARDLDFTFGESVYSTTPRLLFRVPVARENPGAPPVVVEAVSKVVALEVKQAKVTDTTALIIPNQEGAQEKLEERPIVQYSALSAGEYVIIGGLKLADRKFVYDVVADVMNPPEGRSAFQYFDEAGTVEDLAKILDGVQKLGFGNMYNTSEKYRTTNVQPLPAYESVALDASAVSGFYEKPVNAVLSSAVYMPGPTAFIGRGRSEEVLPENGFAVYETVVGEEKFDIKPVSPSFMAANFVDRQSRMNVVGKPAQNMAVMMFKPDHPLRDFMRQYEGFQTALAGFNKGNRPDARPSMQMTA